MTVRRNDDEETTTKREGGEDDSMDVHHLTKTISENSNPKDLGVQLDEVGEVHVQDNVQEDRADLVCLLQAYPHVEVETWEEERVRVEVPNGPVLLKSSLPQQARQVRVLNGLYG